MRAEVVLRLVSGALQDLEPGLESRWRWEGDEGRVGLLDFMNAAIRAIVLQRPDLTAITESVQLEPGMRQFLPSRKRHRASRDATTLIEIVRNMGECGELPGAAIAQIGTDILLAWGQAGATGATVENYACDRMVNPTQYLVYPAVPHERDVWVEATYSASPQIVTSPDCGIGLPDDYAGAIEHHMLASVLAGDNWSANAQKAAWHMSLYNSLMGIKGGVDLAWPKAKSSPAPLGGGQQA